MKCEKCGKNEATVYYRESVNGQTKSWSLCGDCFADMQQSGQIKMETANFWKDPFEDFFSNDFFQTLMAPSVGRLASGGRKKCSLCGSTLEDIVSEGKVGCPKCYEVFENELEDSVRRIHGTGRHTGRAPGKFKEKFEQKKKESELEKQLKEAVKAERFEDAARLRDELKALREGSEHSA